MRYAVTCTIASTVALFTANIAQAEEFKGKDILIGLDLSASTQLVTDQTYATLVAKKVYSITRHRVYGDRIRLRSFGSYDTVKNPLRIDRILSRRNRPKILANAFYHMIGRIPALIKTGKIKAQKSTHIADFLSDMAPSMQCAADRTGAVILFTDGVESSRRTKLDQKSGRFKLPAPAPGLYKHCAFYLYGAGQLGKSSSPKITRGIIAAWTKWARQAGFSKIHVVRVW